MRISYIAAAAAVLLASSVGTASAQDAPPWCATVQNKNPAEHTVCATKSLWHLDDQLNLSYAFAHDRLSAEQKKILEASQADWLKQTRNGCKTDVKCLAGAMQSRADTLDDINTRGKL